MGKYAATSAFRRQRKSGSDNAVKDLSGFFPTVNDFGSEYEYDLYMSQYPFIGRIYSARAERLKAEENLRYWQDKARVNNFDLSEIKYPIRAGIYGSYSSEVYEASKSVMDLYADLRRWF